MNYAIVYKIRPNNKPGTGIVRPVVVVKDGQSPCAATTEEFPNNNEILITRGYEDKFNIFSQLQLFKVEYEENNYSNVDPSAPFYCKYMADGYEAYLLSDAEYPHVVIAPFDINNRQIKINYKPDRYIILLSPSQGGMYGPFAYNEPEPLDDGSFQIELKPCDRLQGFETPNYYVLRFSSDTFSTVPISSEQEILLTDIKGIIESPHDILDFMPDDKLISLANGLLANNKLEKQALISFKNALAQISDSNPKFDNERSQRLVNLVDRVEYWTSQSSSLITTYLETKEGQEKVKQYIRDYKSEFVPLANEIAAKEFEEPRRVLREAIKDLEAQKNQLKAETETLEIKKQQTAQELEENQAGNLNSEISRIQTELDNENEKLIIKKNELESVLQTLDIAHSIEKLRKEEEHLKWLNDREKKQHEQLEQLKDDLIEQINQKDSERKQKLMQVAKDEKPYLDILNGIVPSFNEDKAIEQKTIRRQQNKPNAIALIEDIQKKLTKYYGRNYQFEDIANFLICIDQNFLTIFSGLPGVGKTSLVTCLADVLGLRSQKCFLSIPTARGFTSQRDLLGFYNPLSQRFQPAATGLYEVLLSLKDEQRAFYPYWVLLDEANLSPIEHYFSAFLGMCDVGVSKIVNTGEPGANGVLTVPDSFRFLATINYDNTTEPLSPRMIDRVPIIRIEPPKEEEITAPSSVLADEPMLAYNDLHAILQHDADDDSGDGLTPEEMRILVKVKEALGSNDSSKGMPTIISPRKSQTIKQYCSAARSLMSGNYPLAALDYAVSQHILPLINGYGDKYRKRLDELEIATRQLDRSRLMLKRIIDQGDEEQKFYRYFIL